MTTNLGTFSSSALDGDFAPNIRETSINIYSEDRRSGGGVDTLVYRYEDPNTCIDSDTIIVTILKTPTINNLDLETGYCRGDEVKIGGEIVNDPDINTVRFDFFNSGVQVLNKPYLDTVIIDNPIENLPFEIKALAVDLVTNCYSDTSTAITRVDTIPSAIFEFSQDTV